jgi:hypothetical protein
VPQRSEADCVGTCYPLAGGFFTEGMQVGNLPLGPAYLLEVPGLESLGFFPIGQCPVRV